MTWLIAVAVAFAFVNGVNDGGALLSVGLSVRGHKPLTGLLVAAAAVAIAPLLVGTRVAETLASRLVSFDGAEGELALGVAIVAAVAVTWLLAARGLPTSLTLAVVGAIAGAGAGGALPVSWGVVWTVLVLAAVAPVAGLAVAWLLSRLVRAWPSKVPLNRRVRRWHPAGFGLQCLAYGANDGQKMLAVLAIAAGTAGGNGVPVVAWQLATVAAAFLLGAVVGLPRVARTLSSGVVPARPHENVVTEVASATVVLGTGAMGSPVSMTQAITGGLVGSAIGRGLGSVRWQAIARLGMAWLITLPVAFVAAAMATMAALAVTAG
ncbi:MAG TPA: inorganic phosphate transporter [Egicoccus sp.]|nr:inorganic phosphate transporter [Egicoccus sp.]HSK22538.1 inorganic phosphate transporter [Egicoccus sp.]